MIMNTTNCDAIKLENNKNNYRIIKSLVKKIPVMGHIGFVPQFKKFKLEGKLIKRLMLY